MGDHGTPRDRPSIIAWIQSVSRIAASIATCSVVVACGSYEASIREFRLHAEVSRTNLEQQATSSMRSVAAASDEAFGDSRAINSEDARLKVIRAAVRPPIRNLMIVHLEWHRANTFCGLTDAELANPSLVQGINRGTERVRNDGTLNDAVESLSDELSSKILLDQQRGGNDRDEFLRIRFSRLFTPDLAFLALKPNPRPAKRPEPSPAGSHN